MLLKSFITSALTSEPPISSPERVLGRNFLGKILSRIFKEVSSELVNSLHSALDFI